MSPLEWAILCGVVGVGVGAALAWTIGPRLRRIVRETPPPNLPEHLAPGWHARCTRCGHTRTLASVGGIRRGGNRGALKATLGLCGSCRGVRFIRIVHADHLPTPSGSADASSVTP